MPGYSDIQTLGYAHVGCAATNGVQSTHFTAKGPTGRPVEGEVCHNYLGGNTISLY